ncbi:HAMP domain-containing sensor histidine kinase [Paenibacillus campi]|uniref:sensor histidine kinase n=1 Tax=Paenibacillus campi TaxID=3106031 RepID=UPI002B000900|nr:HAMP domain-containing sensor histidine kinase [Paenibacillus sp. SGZ-1014]
MRLKRRIHLYSSVLFALVLIVTNVFVYIVFSSLTIREQQQRIESQAAKTADNIRLSASNLPVADLLRAYVPLEGMIRIVAAHDSNRLLVTSPNEQSLSQLPVKYESSRISEVISNNGHRYVFISIPVIWHDGRVVNIQVTESLQQTESYLHVLQLVLLIVTGLAMIPVFLSGHIVGRIVIRPIAALTSTMGDIRRSGQFKRIQLEERSRDELYEMGDTFNRMIELLENNYDKQKQFVSNASHELRTPLTIIESYASLLKRRGLDRPDLFMEAVEAIHSEAVRMKEMTEQLLLLARHEEQWNLTLESVDLQAQAEQLSREFAQAYSRQIDIVLAEQLIRMPALGTIWTDAGKLRQLLFILLDNARKYSSDRITLELGMVLTATDEAVAATDTSALVAYERCIRVVDRGIGIPEAELSKVFDRFYRVDQARTRQDSGGSGLGLTLAQRIAEALGASIRLESEEGHGTTAIVILPATAQHLSGFSANSN